MSAMNDLVAGYRRFREGYYPLHKSRMEALAQGQSPRVAVIGCCDSRVDPAVITDSAPGELFVIRNVANLVPPCEGEGTWHGTSAALEFAVQGLQVEHILILGHARCGGIRTLMQQQADPDDHFISAWMRIAEPARQRVLRQAPHADPGQQAQLCELEGIRVSLGNLLTFPWIQERVETGRLQLHGWYYDLAEGRLMTLDPETGHFSIL